MADSQVPFLAPPKRNVLKLLTLARDIRRRKARERQQLFAAEGIRAVEELLRSDIRVHGALVNGRLRETARGEALRSGLHDAGIDVLEVDDADFESAAETETPQGILAIARIPDISLDSLQLGARARIVVLDGVQDPGNVGTIIRTAAALGTSAVVAMPGTVDLWNAKVVRSGMGANFHFPVLSAEWEALDVIRQSHGLAVWGTDAAGALLETLAVPECLALVAGNEGAGLSEDARRRVDTLVALPIGETVESLNVAVATGIFLYQLRP